MKRRAGEPYEETLSNRRAESHSGIPLSSHKRSRKYSTHCSTSACKYACFWAKCPELIANCPRAVAEGRDATVRVRSSRREVVRSTGSRCAATSSTTFEQ